MISRDSQSPLFLRLAAMFAWRTDRRIASKLMGFSATERGSALDMYRAADLVDDPNLRRLFYRHGLDEDRHAQMFNSAAKKVNGGCDVAVRAHEQVHQVRQHLFEKLGLVAFVAFVYVSEAQALKQFNVILHHFRDRPDMLELFRRVGRDEQQHVAYSKNLLDTWRKEGRGKEVDQAMRKVKRRTLWAAWRRSGKQIGSVLTSVVMATLFVGVLFPFALISRVKDRSRSGWVQPTRPVDTRSQG
jgi:rubrerythrin